MKVESLFSRLCVRVAASGVRPPHAGIPQGKAGRLATSRRGAAKRHPQRRRREEAEEGKARAFFRSERIGRCVSANPLLGSCVRSFNALFRQARFWRPDAWAARERSEC